jgi:hypothetical protein
MGDNDRGGELVGRIIQSTGGRYEAQEVTFGTVYKWCPEGVVLECDCGKRATLTSAVNACERCGADYATFVRDYMTLVQEDLVAGQLTRDEDVHPWRYQLTSREDGIPV